MINPCDRISLGWQVWLTPRQTRIIYDALCAVGGDEHHERLVEWFGTEAEIHRKRAALEDYPIYSLYASGEDTYAYNIVVSGDNPTPNATCDINNLNLCDQSGCEALGKYWYDGTCNANAEPVGPSDPEDPATTSGPILRTGSHILRVGDSVLMVQ